MGRILTAITAVSIVFLVVAGAHVFAAGTMTSSTGPTFVYNRSSAVRYALNYYDFVGSDGYFWNHGSTYLELPDGMPIISGWVSTVSDGGYGEDCAHYDSQVLGSPPDGVSGGLNIESRVPPTYGEPGAGRLIEYLLSSGYGTVVAQGLESTLVKNDAISKLSPGDVIGYNWEGVNASKLGPAAWDHIGFYVGDGLVTQHSSISNIGPWDEGGGTSYDILIHIDGQDTNGINETSTPLSQGGAVWEDSLQGWSRDSLSVVYQPSEAVVVGTSNGTLAAFNPVDGRLQWEVNLGAPIESSAVSSGAFIVTATTNGTVWGIANGHVSWKFSELNANLSTENPTGFYSSPLIVGGLAIIGSWNSELYAINVTDGNLAWNFSAVGMLDSTPTVAGGKLFVGDSQGDIYALEPQTGKVIWSSFLPGWIHGSIVSSAGLLFVDTMSGTVGALNQSNGDIIWSRLDPAPIWSSPVIDGREVITSDIEGNLTAHSFNGSVRWSTTLETIPPPDTTGVYQLWDPSLVWVDAIALDSVIYVGTINNQIYEISASGKLLGSIPLTAEVTSDVYPLQDNLVVGVSKGYNSLIAEMAIPSLPSSTQTTEQSSLTTSVTNATVAQLTSRATSTTLGETTLSQTNSLISRSTQQTNTIVIAIAVSVSVAIALFWRTKGKNAKDR